MLQEYKVSHVDVEPTYEVHLHKLSYPEDQSFGKAEGKPPVGRLWNTGETQRCDFRRTHLIQTMRTNFKATLPKLSGLKGFLPPLLFRLTKKSKTMRGGCSEMGLASHHVQSALNTTQSYARVKALPDDWGRWGSIKATAQGEKRKQGRARLSKSNLGN